ncbi:MAG: hypothetical protein HY261_06330, partial [Chloroflexi bacterium]|nr:hypothetical protein [Chloroflexota bacterium]
MKMFRLAIIVLLAQGILAQGQIDRKSIVIDRPPIRAIKDPNPGFAA